MDVNPEIKNVPAMILAFQSATCSFAELGATITSPGMLPPAYEFAESKGAQGGYPVARYLSVEDGKFQLQIGVLLDHVILAEPPFEVLELAESEAVVVEFLGIYGDLHQVHNTIHRFIQENGLIAKQPCLEVYAGPGDESGFARTDVIYPLGDEAQCPSSSPA